MLICINVNCCIPGHPHNKSLVTNVSRNWMIWDHRKSLSTFTATHSSNLTLPLLLHFVFLILIRQCLLSFSHSVSISLTVSDLKSISFHLTYYNSICLPSLSSFLTRRLRGKRKKAAGLFGFLIGTSKGFLREKFGLNSCSETGPDCMLLNMKTEFSSTKMP